jgi:hypothetical protein
MSNLNDNNLDDLLRRAAEKYPLRTDSADFNKLVSDLEEDPSLILPPVTEDRRRRRRFLWLFLLLPLAGGAYYAWHGTSGRSHQTGVALEKQASAGAGMTTTTTPMATKGERNAQNKDNTGIDHTTRANPAKDNTSTDNTSTGNTTKAGTAKANTEKDKITKDNIPKDNTTNGNTTNGNTTNGNTVPGDIVKSDIPKENTTQRDIAKLNSSKQNVSKVNSTKTPAKANGGDGNEVVATAGDVTSVKPVAGRTDNSTTAVSPRSTDHSVSLAPTKNAVAVNIPVKSNTEEPVKKSPAAKDKIKLQKPKPSFYVGIIGSPDLSLIRFQSIKAVGNNFGLLLGYSFNSRWAVETGIYYDRKKYYTEGEYFSKAKVPALRDVDLKTVNGVCYMWEIPLNVRYNFPSGNNKMKWFATAGMSTYLMSKENYTFTGDYWGNPNWTRTWPYKTPYKYWFSILNLSVGYEQRLGKIGNLRLEPFLRVPLAGIGTGSLSIMSAGLNIGITRRIW